MIPKRVTEENSIEEIRAFFSQDQFATRTGCRILEGRAKYARCEMDIVPEILNAHGTVMGGAIFTLADFTMSVAANLDTKPCVAVDCDIRFLKASKGTKLIATCTSDRVGRTLGFYTVTVEDDLGVTVAILSGTVNRFDN